MGKMSALSLSDPGELVTPHKPKHVLRAKGGDDNAEGKGLALSQSA